MIVESEHSALVVPESLRMLALDGDSEIVEEVFTLFRGDTASRLKQIAALLAAGDIVRVRAQAHAVKGSAIQVGALDVAEVCRQLELESADKTLAELQEMIDRLSDSFGEVCRLMGSRT